MTFNKLERMTLQAAIWKVRATRLAQCAVGPEEAIEDVLHLSGLNGADINYAKVLTELKARLS